MQSQITGIHHIAIKCGGVEKFKETVKFYNEILGIPFARSWGVGDDCAVMLDTCGGILEIFSNGGDKGNSGAVKHFAFNVVNTDACIEAVRTAGYEIAMEPNDISIPSNPPYNARIAFCIGPNGEEVEFFQVK